MLTGIVGRATKLTVVALVACTVLIVRSSPVPADRELSSLVEKSKLMRSYMNESADPCDDFYNFACGNWPAIHPATEDLIETNVFNLADFEWRSKTLQILKGRSADDNDVEGKVKDFYESCLELPEETVYAEKLIELVAEFGHMPALEGDHWQERDFDWLRTVAEINHRYGFNIILGFDILPDPSDSSVYRVRVRHPHFRAESEFLDESKRNKYMEEIAKNMKKYLNLNEELAQQTAKEIVAFEASLVKDSKIDVLAKTATYYTRSVKRLHRMYSPQLDFKRLFEIWFGSITKDDVLEIQPEYQENLVKVLKSTPKNIVANYIFYRLVIEFRTPKFPLDTERQNECHDATKKFFANVMDNMMYRRYDFAESELLVSSTFRDIQSFFESALASESYYEWMSKKTRKRAVEKLRAIKLKINSYTDVNFTQEYGRLTVDRHDYAGNLKSIYALQALKTRQKLGGPVQPHYDGAKASYTPQYVITENIIRIPLPTMQEQFFVSPQQPFAFNFAKIGFLLGHEMVHAFDDLGRKYDLHGNVEDWWDWRSSENFDDRTQCFVNQTQTFHYAGKPLAKRQEQGENIADNGGLRMAHEAYKAWHDNALRPQVVEALPHFSYKNDQLFFVSYGQVWCSDMLTDSMDKMLLNDPHLPAYLRVNGVLSNYEDFSLAFNCPKGSGMTPSNTCRIY